MNHKCMRTHAISVLMANDPDLIDFVLNSERTCLVSSSESILIEAGVLSTGEQVLVRTALDIWDSSGYVSFTDIVYSLDACRLEAVLLAIQVLRFSSLQGFPIAP